MRCKCKVLSVNGIPASDGSIIPLEVMNSYINSQECKDALKSRKMIGTLTHRSRSIQSVFPDTGAALSKVVGKDDSMLIVDSKAPSPTHVIEDLYIEDGWLWANIKVLDEDGMDDVAIQNIRRLRGLLSQGIHPGVSAVIVGYWDSAKGGDILRLCKIIKSVDITLNPSWSAASITEIYDDENKMEEVKEFSEKEVSPKDYEFTGLKVKTFSNLSELGVSGPKSSKINGQFTQLMVKEFSSMGTVIELSEVEEPKQKDFSQSEIRERLRESKLGNRMLLRRKYMSYKQAVRSLGGIENIKEEDLKILKSLFTSDILNILSSKEVTEGIVAGKQINTLLGLSALSKTARIYGQNLQIPLRMAHMEARRQGFISKQRYQKLQSAYLEFINGLMSDVFGENPEPIPPEDEEINNEENNNK